jgi:hypothetical protein
MIHKKDYFGYIYKWTNIKNEKHYIGSHYGSIEDSYIGSGKAFKPAYYKNPNDFKLTILEYITEDDKKLVLKTEQKWLDTIDNIRKNKSYYNLNNYAIGGSSHITKKHIQKRANTLKQQHKKYGLSNSEISSYHQKIKSRLTRIAELGFTDKEKAQHQSYSIQLEVTMPTGELKIFNSITSATLELGVDAKYGLKVCKTKESFKNFKFKKIRDPLVDCRKKNEQLI